MKIWLIGSVCAGKSHIAEQLAERLKTNHFELDGVYWTLDWKVKDENEFIKEVDGFLNSDSWIIDGSYNAILNTVSKQADVLILVEVSFMKTCYRVIKRTFNRLFSKRTFWSGHKESVGNVLKKNGILDYAIFNYRNNRRRNIKIWDKYPGGKIKVNSKTPIINIMMGIDNAD